MIWNNFSQAAHFSDTNLSIFCYAFEHAAQCMIITDSQFRTIHVNQAFTQVTGYTEDEIRHQDPKILQSDRHPPKFYTNMRDQLYQHDSWAGEIWNQKKDGTVYLDWLDIRAIKNIDGEIRYYLGCFKDITELREKERQLLFMAYHDTMTSLPNRAMLEKHLGAAINQAQKNNSKLALLIIDLDNFKMINNSLGYDQGNKLLCKTANRIAWAASVGDMLFRQWGDEFILLVENIYNDATIHDLVSKIFLVLRDPIIVDNKSIKVTLSIGIALFPDHGDNVDELTKFASMAKYRAKANGKNQFMFYCAEMQKAMLAKFKIESDMRTGLEQGDFFLHFQPKIRCNDKKISSLEALLRWKHQGQLIPPNVFIPVAEESGLIEDLGWIVIEHTCSFIHQLQAAGHHIPIAVNLSLRQFSKENLVEILDKILLQHSIDPMLLELEITESTAMTNIDLTLDIMSRLRQRGFQFAIDDFGTGYSSLSYLKQLPISALKIDKRFVDELKIGDTVLAETILSMGQKLGLTVIAEGVEYASQFDILCALGCDEVQGYLFSPPISAEKIIDFLEQHNP